MPSQSKDAGEVAGRYASALYELADADKALDRVADDLRAFSVMRAENADLALLVTSPVVGRDAQAAALTALAEKAGFHALTIKFFGTLARNRRVRLVSGIVDAFLAELAHRRGEVTAEVTSATALKPDVLDRVRAALASALGAKVALQTQVDGTLIGGLKVRIGSKMVDASLATKLQKLRLSMKGIG